MQTRIRENVIVASAKDEMTGNSGQQLTTETFSPSSFLFNTKSVSLVRDYGFNSAFALVTEKLRLDSIFNYVFVLLNKTVKNLKGTEN